MVLCVCVSDWMGGCRMGGGCGWVLCRWMSFCECMCSWVEGVDEFLYGLNECVCVCVQVRMGKWVDERVREGMRLCVDV